MLQGKDFIILTHAECEALHRLSDLVPMEKILEAGKANDLGVCCGLNLIRDIKRAIYPS